MPESTANPDPRSPDVTWRISDLADLHAGCLDPEATVRLSARVFDDPLAQQTLAALDDTVEKLAQLPTVAMPAEVVAQLDAALTAELQTREVCRHQIVPPPVADLAGLAGLADLAGSPPVNPQAAHYANWAQQQAVSAPGTPGAAAPVSQAGPVAPASPGWPANAPVIPLRPLAVPPVLPGATPLARTARRRGRLGITLAAAAVIAATAVIVPLALQPRGATPGAAAPAPHSVDAAQPSALASLKDLRGLRLEASSMPEAQFQACLAANNIAPNHVLGATVDQWGGKTVVVIGVQRADGAQYRVVVGPTCGKQNAAAHITTLPAAP